MKSARADELCRWVLAGCAATALMIAAWLLGLTGPEFAVALMAVAGGMLVWAVDLARRPVSGRASEVALARPLPDDFRTESRLAVPPGCRTGRHALPNATTRKPARRNPVPGCRFIHGRPTTRAVVPPSYRALAKGPERRHRRFS